MIKNPVTPIPIEEKTNPEMKKSIYPSEYKIQ